MCMRNINTNVVFADIVPNENGNGIFSLQNVGKKFTVVEQDGKKKITTLSMALLISASEEKNNEHESDETTFTFDKNYEVRVRLTETYSGSFIDLATIIVEPSKTVVERGICKKSFNHTQLCYFKDISLPPDEKNQNKYVVKIVLRATDSLANGDGKFFVQSIHPVDFVEPFNK